VKTAKELSTPPTLCLRDVAALFELHPQVFVNGYLGSVESHLSTYAWPVPLPIGADDDVLAPPLPVGAGSSAVASTVAPPPAVLGPKAPTNGIASQRSQLPPAAGRTGPNIKNLPGYPSSGGGSGTKKAATAVHGHGHASSGRVR
jgi:hypothetical protein